MIGRWRRTSRDAAAPPRGFGRADPRDTLAGNRRAAHPHAKVHARRATHYLAVALGQQMIRRLGARVGTQFIDDFLHIPLGVSVTAPARLCDAIEIICSCPSQGYGHRRRIIAFVLKIN